MDTRSFVKTRNLIQDTVVERLVKENFRRITLDFDGSVLSTNRKVEGSAELKMIVESRARWVSIDDKWSYFESEWKPKSWN